MAEATREHTSYFARFGAWAWAPFVAAAPGWTTQVLAHPDPVALVRENANPHPGVAALHMLAGALVVVALWAVLAPRLQTDGRTRVQAWREAVLATRVLLLGPIVLALIHAPDGFLNAGRPLLVLLGGWLAAASVRRWPSVPPSWSGMLARVLGGSRWPITMMLVSVGVIALLLIRLALWRHHGFETRAFDLGIYDNTVWNTAHGAFLRCTLIKAGVHTAAHFDPILLPISWLYLLAPRAETLLVIQALWVLSGVIPAYLIALRRLDDKLAAVMLAVGMALYPSVHGVILFEFHSLALLAAPALWMIWCLDAERRVGYWLAFAVALLVREDASLFVAGVGVYALLATEQRKLGALTIALALAYLVFVKFAIMPDSDLLMRNSEHNYSYTNRYRRLIPEGGSARDGLATLLTNPAFVLGHVITTPKLTAALAFWVPLGLLPLAAGKRLLLCVYGLAFMFLASHTSIFYPLFHYSTVLVPTLFAATPEGLARVQAWLERRGDAPGRARATVLGWLGTCLVLGSLAMGGLVEVEPFQLSRELVRDYGPAQRERYAWFERAVAEIPADASVSASNRVAPHLSNRAEFHIVQQRIETDWFVVVVDDLEADEGAWLAKLRESGAYEEVAREHGFWLLRRATDANTSP